MLAEPPPTQADLHFNLFGFPVRVHPLFWVVALLIGLNSFEGEAIGALISVGVIFVSILVHELGHAFLQRRFGGWPRIVLHGFGGLAICGDCDRSPRSQILISLAGPAAGFLFAIITLLLLKLTNGYVAFEPFWGDRSPVAQTDAQLLRLPLAIGTLWFEGFASRPVNITFVMLLWVNIFWGLMNLLPVYPLDGGQVAREVMTLGSDPHAGMVRSMQLSIGVAVAAAVWGLIIQRSFLLPILFGFLAYNNYRTLQSYTGHGPGLGWG